MSEKRKIEDDELTEIAGAGEPVSEEEKPPPDRKTYGGSNEPDPIDPPDNTQNLTDR